MANTIAKLHAQIAKLQNEAGVLKEKEVAGVVARMKVAIEHDGLTAADLGFSGRVAKTFKPAGKVVAKKARNKAAKKTSGVIRFRDEAVHTWTGHGKRPNWYLAANEAGKTPESLAV